MSVGLGHDGGGSVVSWVLHEGVAGGAVVGTGRGSGVVREVWGRGACSDGGVTMRRVKLNQVICRGCMAKERTAIFVDGVQEGKVCGWDMLGGVGTYDSVAWLGGLVHCPHRMHEVGCEEALEGCLRRGGQEAAASGCLVIGEW